MTFQKGTLVAHNSVPGSIGAIVQINAQEAIGDYRTRHGVKWLYHPTRDYEKEIYYFLEAQLVAIAQPQESK